MATSDRSTFNLQVASVQGENLGAGEGIFAQKVSGNTLQFKSLVAGSGVNLISGASTITISAGTGGGGGETNAGINVGSGVGIYTGKTGVNLEFKSLVAGANIGLDNTNPTQITISAATGGGGSVTASNGLSIAGSGDVILGGTLTGNTTINNTASGFNIGTGNYSQSRSVAFGYNSIATGNTSFASGCAACAFGQNSHAFGFNTKALSQFSHATGRGSISTGNGSHAEGLYSISTGIASHAEGSGRAYGDYSHAGGRTQALGKGIYACGCASFNHSNNDVGQTAGYGANADFSAILGGLNHHIDCAAGDVASAILGGQCNIICNNSCHSAIISGCRNELTGDFSLIAGGQDNTLQSTGQAIIGGNNNNLFGSGQGAIIAGTNNQNGGQDSVLVGGSNNNLNGANSIMLGGNGMSSSLTNNVTVPNLQIFVTPATSAGGDQVLLRNSSGVVTQNTCATVSDCRLKTNLQSISNTIESLDYIDAYIYELTEPSPEAGKTTYGLLAQDVEGYFPHAVKENYNVEVSGTTQTFKALEYRELVPVLWDIVKKHESRIKILEAQLP